MAFVLMKIFEEAPRRFDRWMNVLTFGRLERIRDQISGEFITPGTRVLEIGCGTGALLAKLTEQAAEVVGIDSAQAMIDESQEKLARCPHGGQVTVKRLHALQVEDEFAPATFDHIVSVLAFSEMSDAEIDCLLPQCRQALKPGGSLILVDEVEPVGAARRAVYFSYRFVSRFATFLGLQAIELKNANFFLKVLYFAIELPLMILTFLVVPSVTHPLTQMERRIEGAGFSVRHTRSFLGGTLKLFHAEAIGA